LANKNQPKPDKNQASVNKALEALRADRKLAPILDAWRAAMKANPTEWGLK
jgi:ABC-type amino acid transport substrate-binding protein